MIDWLLTNALAALALAVVAGVLVWTFRPAPAVRHALWLVIVLKLVSPTGFLVTVPLPVERPAPRSVEAPVPLPTAEPIVEEEFFTVVVTPEPGQTVEEAAAVAIHTANVPAESAAEASPGPPAPPFNHRPYLLAAWAIGAAFTCWRQLRETIRFARFSARALPAGDALVAEVAVVANRLGVRVPAVRVLVGLTSPVMWCLWRPVLLWPAGLDSRLKGEGKRAVIAHELAHLRRRDHWVRRLEMVAAILHWWNPLFWVARSKLRADAELACDAWAAGQADRRAYAEALLEVCSFNPRRRPAPAVGVIGEGRRALQERLTMIMRDRAPCRLAFGAKLVVAVMALAAVPAWTLGQSRTVEVETDVTEVPVATELADPEVQAVEKQVQYYTRLLEKLKAAKRAEAEKAGADKVEGADDQLKFRLRELRLQLEQSKDVEKMKPVVTPARILIAGQNGVKVYSPDGKEIKDAKIVIGEGPHAIVKPIMQPKLAVPANGPHFQMHFGAGDAKHGNFLFTPATQAAAGNTITLSRATYKVGKEKAAALASLLGSIKATVMETKVDGETIVVTTTPEAQAAIGQIVRLLVGQDQKFTIRWAEVVPAPAVPAVPAAPKTPKPNKATEGKPNGAGANLELELKLNPLTGTGEGFKLIVPKEGAKPEPAKKPAVPAK